MTERLARGYNFLEGLGWRACIIRKMGFNGPFHCVRTSRSLLVSIKIKMTGMLLSIVHGQVEKTLTKT